MKKTFVLSLLFSTLNSFALTTNWENFIQDLPCASGLFGIGNTSAFVDAKKASFATGKILESLEILALTSCEDNQQENYCSTRASKTINDFQDCIRRHETTISQCSIDYPYLPTEGSMQDKVPFLSSFGLHDACNEIPGYKYCNIMVFHQPSWTYGVCIPEVCSIDEIKHSLQKVVVDKGASIQNNQLFSSTCGDYSFPWTAGTSTMICICCLLLFLVLIGTFLKHQETSSPSEQVSENIFFSIVKCFSLQINFKFLLEPSRGGPFDSFDGIRTFSILWVIFGHTFVFTMIGLGFTNLIDLIGIHNQGWITTYPAQALTGGYFAVDTFFFLSAFLAMFFLMKRANEFILMKKSLQFFLQIPLLYWKRFLRLTPTYFFILLMYLKILPQLDSGPFWNLLNTDIEFCSSYWWTNLLYINNLYPSGSQGCYAVTWYLANDFQFFLLVPFFAILSVSSFKRHSHLFSICLLTLGCFLSIVFAFVESYKQHWSINIYDPNFLNGYFVHYYTKPWFRCPPYFMGMILAIIWYCYYDENTCPFNDKKEMTTLDVEIPLLDEKILTKDITAKCRGYIKNNVLFKYFLFLISASLFALTTLGERGAYTNIPPDWSNETMSFYISLSKPAWTLGLCILSLLLFLKELPIITIILENHLMSILARLTFCAYLIHPSILYWFYFSQTYPIHFNGIWYALTFLSISLASFLLSIIIYIVVERPIANLEKLTK